ncbi:MAG: flavodoxin family protein [Deltaproteobacteria bacterium]|nr:flavodoxin family protein [Deltaproteobacteria bacterium]
MKISIVYHSETGNTKKVADLIAEGAGLDGRVDVRTMSVDDIDEGFLEGSAAIVVGCPTHRGSFSWQMKKWIGTTRLKLAGKLGSVFATEAYIGGGADFAELELVAHLLVMGLLVYSAGAGRGQPFTHFGAVAIKDGDDAQKERARIFGQRVAEKAVELFGRG